MDKFKKDLIDDIKAAYARRAVIFDRGSWSEKEIDEANASILRAEDEHRLHFPTKDELIRQNKWVW